MNSTGGDGDAGGSPVTRALFGPPSSWTLMLGVAETPGV